MYCENCGTEISDDSKFCKECGHKLIDYPQKEQPRDASNEADGETDNASEMNNETSNEIETKTAPKTMPKASKSKNDKTVIILLIALVAIAAIVLFGLASMGGSTDDTGSEDTTVDEPLSPAFKDTIYGIDFEIPEGYETFDGTDNQNKGTMTTYDRSYMGPDANIIRISVSTTQGNFYWDLSQNREYNDVEKTINGHEGVLKSSGVFSYVDGEKLVVIDGASTSQLKEIIID